MGGVCGRAAGAGEPGARSTTGEYAELLSRVLETARARVQGNFKKELARGREAARKGDMSEQALRGYQNAGRPSVERVVLEQLAQHHAKNRDLYAANAQLLVRRAPAPALAAVRDPADAQGLVGRDEARQLTRKFLLMQKLDPPVGALWREFDRLIGVVSTPEEYDYHVLHEATTALRREVWRDMTLLLDEMADEYRELADQVFERAGATNPGAPPEAQHARVDDFIEAYVDGARHLTVRTSLALQPLSAEGHTRLAEAPGGGGAGRLRPSRRESAAAAGRERRQEEHAERRRRRHRHRSGEKGGASNEHDDDGGDGHGEDDAASVRSDARRHSRRRRSRRKRRSRRHAGSTAGSTAGDADGKAGAGADGEPPRTVPASSTSSSVAARAAAAPAAAPARGLGRYPDGKASSDENSGRDDDAGALPRRGSFVAEAEVEMEPEW